ncbi:MAG: hypothetical protein ACHQJ5_03075 [Vicinamibacteria bacterium]
MSQASERIHEIIDAAERVALEIRSDAESEAAAYLAERKREADQLAEARTRESERAVTERTAALDSLIKTLADSAEHFKRQGEVMLADLDRVIADARSGVGAERANFARDDEPLAPVPEPESPQPPRPRPAPAIVAFPGRAAAGDERDRDQAPGADDQTSEAVLRVTQLAVVGKGRKEILKELKGDFPDVDMAAIVDEILG